MATTGHDSSPTVGSYLGFQKFCFNPDNAKVHNNENVIYVVTKGEEILYIGQTEDLVERFDPHEREDDFIGEDADTIYVSKSIANDTKRKNVESCLIYRYRPVLNKQSTQSCYNGTKCTTWPQCLATTMS